MEPVTLKVKLSDLIYRVRFSRPLFEMVNNLKFFKDLYDSYEKFGLRLQDMKTERPTANPSDLAVSFNLVGNNINFLIKLDGLEVTFLDPVRLGDGVYVASFDNQNLDIRELVSLGLRSIKTNFDPVDLQFHDFIYDAHCFIEGKGSHTYIQQYIKEIPQELGEPIGSAVGFYFGDPREQRVSNVTLDQSKLINGGIFFKIEMLYGTSLSLSASVFDQAFKHFNDILSALKINLEAV